VAKASGVPDANGALVVDGGDVELQRCQYDTHPPTSKE
jgi:hypothetical protein